MISGGYKGKTDGIGVPVEKNNREDSGAKYQEKGARLRPACILGKKENLGKTRARHAPF